MAEYLSFEAFSKDKGLFLATTGAVSMAIIIKFAKYLQVETAYFNTTKGNVAYTFAFTFVGSVFFLLLKFNEYYGVKIIQDPEDQIKDTLIEWYGIGGILIGVGYGLGLMEFLFFKIRNLIDICRIVAFVLTSKIVFQLRQGRGETEGLQFLLDFDYKTFNITVLIISTLLSLFFLSKKFFIGVLIATTILFSQAFLKDKVFSLDFFVFLVVFNLIDWISSPSTSLKNKQQSKQNEQKQSTSEISQKVSEVKSETSADLPKKEENKENQQQKIDNNKISSTQESNPPKKVENQKKVSKLPQNQNKDSKIFKKSEISIGRVIAASVISGVGYGICGILPETALLNIAVFTPHVTLVFTITFVVGYVLILSILAIIEFDEAVKSKEILQDEYEAIKKQQESVYNPPGIMK